MTHFPTVRDVRRARAFYADVLGGRVVMEENPCIDRLANCWVIMNPGGGPAPDKPDVELVSSMRDPDGYLIEVGQATGLVEGRLAEQAPAGREAGRADGR
jgi:hypothetical protein